MSPPGATLYQYLWARMAPALPQSCADAGMAGG
jgi:hypothetical protein